VKNLIVRGAGVALFALLGGLLLVGRADAGNGYDFDDTAPFSWVDACAEGDVLADISDEDDEYQSEVPIGFSFPFAGSDYDNVEPTTNGVISFDEEGNDEYDNEEIPTAEWTYAALFPWWDDLDTDYAGQVCAATVGTAPNRAFVVEWEAVGDHNIGSETDTISFEAVLCETSGNVVFQYLDSVFGNEEYPEKDNAGDASVGIQEDEEIGVQYSFNEAVINDEMAIVFFPTGGSAENCVAEAPPEPTPTATTAPEEPTPTAPPSGLSLTAGDTSLAAGEETEITATVLDDAGNPVAGVNCVFHLISQPGNSANVDPGPFTTNADGEASTTLHAGNTPGTVQVEAECGAFTQVLDVVVSPALPSTGTGGPAGDMPYWPVALAGGLALLGLGALRLRRA
jgi:hypothetical protein